MSIVNKIVDINLLLKTEISKELICPKKISLDKKLKSSFHVSQPIKYQYQGKWSSNRKYRRLWFTLTYFSYEQATFAFSECKACARKT